MVHTPRLPQTLQMLTLALVSGTSALLLGCGGGYGGGGNGGGSNPPGAPTGLTGTAGNGQVSLSWTASSGASGYYVRRSTSGGTEAEIASVATNTYTDTSVTNGTTYYYVVSAYNSYGASGNSNEVNATPRASAPSAPTRLSATASNAQVALAWNVSTGATSYNVKRSTTSGSETLLMNVMAPSFTDSGVTNGTTYYYVVSAMLPAGESANSTEVSAIPTNGGSPDATITLDPAVTQPISPYIYGINSYSGIPNAPKQLTFDRAGGNRWTAYNWINNASNAGSDYHYQNDDYLCNASNQPPCDPTKPAEAVRLFIQGDQTNGLASLVTLQMQGYVSVDTNVLQVPQPFPDLNYFRPVVYQKSSASAAPFTTTPPPPTTDSNVYMDEFAWNLDQLFSGQNIFGSGAAQATFISLDNEPDLWNSTHTEVQGSTNVSTATFVTKTVNLSSALKNLTKNGQTPAGHFSNLLAFGPVNYGFEGIYSWQNDPTISPTPSGTDWFADHYLQGIHTASVAYGAPLVDVYDFHWYSEVYDSSGTRVLKMTGTNLSDAQIQLIVQSPRDLWDTTWMDTGNSNPWIVQTLGGPINILGRLKAKIAAENPGMKLAITEYENGGFNHIAGTIAQADNLGIFGSQGLFAASFWPPSGTYSYTLAGFLAYRDFDGAGANFGDTSLQSTSSDVASVVVYASTDTTTPGRVVLVAINRSNASKVTVISGQALTGAAHLFQMTATSSASQSVVQPVPAGTFNVTGSSLVITLPAYSVTTIDVH